MEKRATVLSGAQFLNGRAIKRSKLYRMIADDDFVFFKKKQLIEQFLLCEHEFQSLSETRKRALTKHSQYEDYLLTRLRDKLMALPPSHPALKAIDAETLNRILNN